MSTSGRLGMTLQFGARLIRNPLSRKVIPHATSRPGSLWSTFSLNLLYNPFTGLAHLAKFWVGHHLNISVAISWIGCEGLKNWQTKQLFLLSGIVNTRKFLSDSIWIKSLMTVPQAQWLGRISVIQPHHIIYAQSCFFGETLSRRVKLTSNRIYLSSAFSILSKTKGMSNSHFISFYIFPYILLLPHISQIPHNLRWHHLLIHFAKEVWGLLLSAMTAELDSIKNLTSNQTLAVL